MPLLFFATLIFDEEANGVGRYALKGGNARTYAVRFEGENGFVEA